MPVQITDTDFTLAAGMSLGPTLAGAILRSGSGHLTIDGLVQIAPQPSDPGLASDPTGAVAAIDSVIAGPVETLVVDYGGGGLLVTGFGAVRIDTTATPAAAIGIKIETGPPLRNDGLIEVHAMRDATGVAAVTEVFGSVPLVSNNALINVVSQLGSALGILAHTGWVQNAGFVDVSGAVKATGIEAFGSAFVINKGHIVTHDLGAGAQGVAVLIHPELPWTFNNSGLVQGDLALQVLTNPLVNDIGLSGQLTNTGQMIGGVVLSHYGDTFINSGSVVGAIDLGFGNDTYDGRLGTELGLLQGGAGDDTLMGGAGFDNLQGNMGDDSVSGGAGDDIVVGGKDNDVLSGGDGNDVVWSNLGNDTLDGGAGNDQVRGGQGDDSVSGGAGNDFVSGDRGNDTIAGGAGADLFHDSQDAGIDKVLDFNLAEGDRVMLDPGTTYTVSQVGSDTVIDMGSGNQMILVGVQMSTLTTGWIFNG